MAGATTARGGIITGCPGIGCIIAGGRVKVCGIAMPGGGITGATVATVGGAIIVAGAIVGRTIPGKATINHKRKTEMKVNYNSSICKYDEYYINTLIQYWWRSCSKFG